MEPLLRIRDLSVTVLSPGLELPVLHQVDLELYPGRATVLLGPSGSGKSTLAALILGVLPLGQYRVDSGAIFWQEEGAVVDLLTLEPARRQAWWGRRIAQIFQEPGAALNPVLTVGDQLLEVCGRQQADAMNALLMRLGLGPGEYLDRYPWQLSGGQQQRILLAMSLFPRPALLLADEPTAALDRHHQQAFLDLLGRRIREENPPALLLVTHDRKVAAGIADEVVLLEGGRVIRKGLPMEILPQTTALQPFVTPEKAAGAAPLTALLELLDLRAGYLPDQTAIQVDHLRVSPGEILGLAGPSGGGKTSLLRAILGLLPWQKGQRLSLGSEPAPEQLGRLFPLIYQDPGRSFNPALTIGQAFAEIRRYQVGPGPDPRDVLSRLGLSVESLDRRPHQFSGGQKQRLAIARALLGQPRVLLCDEPFSSLDADLRDAFLVQLRQLCREEGLAALLVAHDLPMLLTHCDRVALIDQGRLQRMDTPEGLLDQPDRLFRILLA
jgi:peptide/nickel transport system ATP-binding protein